MKKVLCLITIVILAISFTYTKVSATQKTIILDSYLLFDVWQGKGETSVTIEENYLPFVKLTPSDFEVLTIGKDKVNDKDFDITACNGSTIITLKENYLSKLEDGCYYMNAEFMTAIIPIKLYVVRQSLSSYDICYNFTPWQGVGTSTVILTQQDSITPIWPDLFETLSISGKVINQENYNIGIFANTLSITLSEDYLKSFTPGIYYFTADFVNLKNIIIKLRIFGENSLGDIDGDTKITANDARITLRASVNLENLSTEQKLVADIDSDNKITAFDARALLRISVGLEKNELIVN